MSRKMIDHKVRRLVLFVLLASLTVTLKGPTTIQSAGIFAWAPSNTSGFGSSQNQAVLSLTPFGGQLYAGTYNPFSGSGAQLWRTSAGGGWTAVITHGFSITNNVGIDHLIEFKGNLYAGTWADDASGGEVWRSSTGNGMDWTRVVSQGFGDPTNGEVFRFAVFSDTLYASTWSYSTAHGTQLYSTTTGNTGDWTRVIPNGFGDANNSVILSFETFQGRLYAGTNNAVSGGEVWRTENGVTWTQVNVDGFGTAAYAQVSALAAFDGDLYASTTGTSGVTGASVWRCQVCDGSDWAKVADNGLGNADTPEQNTLQVYGGRLYFVAGNSPTGLEVWRTRDGASWEQVGFAGFGDSHNVMTNWDNSTTVFNNSLYVGTWNMTDGGEVWQLVQDAPSYVRAITLTPPSPVGIQSVTFDVLFSQPMDVGLNPQITALNYPDLRWTPRFWPPTARAELGVATASNGKIYAIGGWNAGNFLATVEEYDPATNTWRTCANMPTARSRLGVAAASNGKIYAVGGLAYNMALASVEEYDPATDTWTTRANMPTARYWLGVAAASNGKIYAIGGTSSGNAVTTVEEYDPATDTWATSTNMPTARYGLGVATASNDKIYAIGGSDHWGYDLATVEVYEPATNSWRTRADMPWLTRRTGLGAAAASNGKIYAIGGQFYIASYGSYDPSSRVDEYDPATDTWTRRPDMPTARAYLGTAATSNGKLYAFGGDGHNAGIYGIVEEYDPATEIWVTRSDSTPRPRGRPGVAEASNGKLYVIGGYSGGALATVEEYDPATDTWKIRANMPTARYGLGVAAASNGKVYAIGGVGSGDLTTVEEYDPATDTWATRASMPTARNGFGVAAASNGKLYVIGGSGYLTGSLATVEEYNPATDIWSARASMPTRLSGLGVVAASNGKIYAIGGSGSSVEEYDPVADTWTTRASTSTAGSMPGVAAASNGKIYVLGGYYADFAVQEYDPATDTWTPRASMPMYAKATTLAAATNGKLYAIGGQVQEATIPFEIRGFYGGQWQSDTQYRAKYDFTALILRDTYTLTVSGAVEANGIEIAPYSGSTFTVDYDVTPPPGPSVWADFCRESTTSAAARWSAHDPDSAIDQYRYALGTSPGGGNVITWTTTISDTVTRTDLSLVSGQRYYFSVKARNTGGLWSGAGSGGFTAGVPCSKMYLPLALKSH